MTPLEEARRIVAEAIHADATAIGEDASIETLAGWDSIAHVTIMMAVEERTGGALPPDAVIGMISVQAIAAYLERMTA